MYSDPEGKAAGAAVGAGVVGCGLVAGAIYYCNQCIAPQYPQSTPNPMCPGNWVHRNESEEKSTSEEILTGARDVTVKGKITQGVKSGGQAQADKYFAGLVGGAGEPTGTPGVRTGKTRDGRTVNIYPESSTTGGPTVEVINPDGTRTKVRY